MAVFAGVCQRFPAIARVCCNFRGLPVLPEQYITVSLREIARVRWSFPEFSGICQNFWQLRESARDFHQLLEFASDCQGLPVFDGIIYNSEFDRDCRSVAVCAGVCKIYLVFAGVWWCFLEFAGDFLQLSEFAKLC